MAVNLRRLRLEDLAVAESLLTRACLYDNARVVAKEKLFGASPSTREPHVLGATQDDRLCGIVVTSAKWIRLLAVATECCDRQIGHALLGAAERAIKVSGAAEVRTMDEPGNYLSPGIDKRNREMLSWLERQGYSQATINSNLVVDVRANDRVTVARGQRLSKAARALGYEVRRAQTADLPELRRTIGAQFSAAWVFEVEAAMTHRPAAVHVAVRDGHIAAFAAHDGNNAGLGWFGPAATFVGHQKKGLGAALLVHCLLDVQRDHTQCEIAWIGPRAFYERAVGIVGERTFVVMGKELTGND